MSIAKVIYVVEIEVPVDDVSDIATLTVDPTVQAAAIQQSVNDGEYSIDEVRVEATPADEDPAPSSEPQA